MCGIVGYVGKEQAAPILLEGLTKLEYRGYDSAGIAVRDGDSAPVTVKEKGRIADLKDKIGPVESIVGTCGIGHTRWATHGDPSMINAHPHVSGNCSGSGSGAVESDVVGVHPRRPTRIRTIRMTTQSSVSTTASSRTTRRSGTSSRETDTSSTPRPIPNASSNWSTTIIKSMVRARCAPSPAPSCVCAAPTRCASCSRTTPARSSAPATAAR